jgi:hypothetical protein
MFVSRHVRTIWVIAIILCTVTVKGADSPAAPSPAPRARVVAVHNPDATLDFLPDAAQVEAMVSQAITNLTGKPTVKEAWTSLVGSNEVVGIKVYTSPGGAAGTRPQVAAAVVKGLLAAGLPANHIIIWDRLKADLRHAGYQAIGDQLGVRVEGAAEAGFDAETFYETALVGNLVYGDLEFGSKASGAGRKSFVSKLVTKDMTKIINIAPVINHNSAGVAGNLFSLAMGSVDNINRFGANPERLALAVPEIYALPVLGDRVVLNISDALLCQYEGEDRGLLHYSVALNEIRLSHDPVALDVLALEDLKHFRASSEKTSNRELYKNAALLELGVCELKLIDVVRLGPPGPAWEH